MSSLSNKSQTLYRYISIPVTTLTYDIIRNGFTLICDLDGCLVSVIENVDQIIINSVSVCYLAVVCCRDSPAGMALP